MRTLAICDDCGQAFDGCEETYYLGLTLCPDCAETEDREV